MDKLLTLHLFQWEVIPGDVGRNLRKLEQMLKGTDIGKGDLIILPEMFPSGFYYENLDEISGQSEEVLMWITETTRHYGAGMAGSLPTRVRGGVANTMFLVDPEGAVLARYDKMHLFPGTGEDRYFIPGDEVVTTILGGVKIGLAVCFDLRFPELSRRLCLEGAGIVLFSAQWPMARIDHLRDLVRIRAMENQMFVAACNSCGKDASGMFLGGGSMVADPSGTIAGALGTEEGVLSLQVSLEEVTRVRREFPVLNCRREDVFGER
jgi:omega-amidase